MGAVLSVATRQIDHNLDSRYSDENMSFERTFARWRYGPDPTGLFEEYGLWVGNTPPTLRLHFHPYAQFTLLIAGRRLFRIGGDLFVIEAGQFLYIPAGMPHQGITQSQASTKCLNIYMADRQLGARPFVADLPIGDVSPKHLAGFLRIMAEHVHLSPLLHTVESPSLRNYMIDESIGSVSELAALHGLGRENFTRRFVKDVGIPPHAYRLVHRLNEGRTRLRAGATIAAVAADLHFADQSHFGRQFRQTFGISPLAYKRGFGTSQSFQTL